MRKSSFLLASCFALCLSTPALAQRTTATLRGTVVDPSQALVPGAAITAKHEDTSLTRTTATNDSGANALPDLPIGRYRVNAELQGFKTASRTGIILRVADDHVVDFRVTDTVKLQFRWDVFNVFNNASFRGVNAVLQPSSAVLNNPSPNATIIESAVIPASFGQATSTRDARQMQFGLKIIW